MQRAAAGLTETSGLMPPMSLPGRCRAPRRPGRRPWPPPPRRTGWVVAAMLLAGPASAGEPAGVARGPLLVAAAASLTEVLPRLAAAGGADATAVQFRFDASSRLARQIEAGAPADLFVSADEEWMDHLGRAGRLVAASRVLIAGNRLVAVVARGEASAPGGPAELARFVAHDRLALAGEAVPAGRYARAALEATSVWSAVGERVVRGDSVRSALLWVARGEARAAVVYATDALVEPRVRVAFAFADSTHPPIVYPAAILAGTPHRAEAERFLASLRTPEARALLEQAGFTAPPGPAALPVGK